MTSVNPILNINYILIIHRLLGHFYCLAMAQFSFPVKYVIPPSEKMLHETLQAGTDQLCALCSIFSIKKS